MQTKLFLLACAISLLPVSLAQWPCPVADDFLPCTCTEDDNYDISVDCSAAKDQSELQAAFSIELPFPNFRSLKINQVNCDDCAITILAPGDFGTASFQSVLIEGTAVARVEGGAFAGSESVLQTLNLRRNNISYFDWEVLSQYTALVTLNLQNNQFNKNSQIPALTSSSLKRLDMSGNPNLFFSYDMVAAVPELVELHMKEGDITSIPMEILDVSGMFEYNKNLKVVDFKTNIITDLGTNIIQGKILNSVDFSRNSISTVHKNFVEGFGSRGDLNLKNNKIESLTEEIWSGVIDDLKNNNGTVELEGNPLTCGCEIAWLVLDDDRMNVISDNATCNDGVTDLHDLPKAVFEQCGQ